MTISAFTFELPGPDVFNTTKPNWPFVTVAPPGHVASKGPLEDSGCFCAPGGTGSASLVMVAEGRSAVGPPGRMPISCWSRSACADNPVTLAIATTAPTASQSRVLMVHLHLSLSRQQP